MNPVSVKTSAWNLSEADSTRIRGRMKKIAIATRIAMRTSLDPPRDRRRPTTVSSVGWSWARPRSRALVMTSLLRPFRAEQPEVDDADHHHHRGHDECHRRGKAELPPSLEARLVDVEQHWRGLAAKRAGRTSARDDLGLSDELERGQDLQRDHEQHDRPEAGQRDRLELLPAVRPVHGRRLVQVGGDGLHARQEDDRVEPDRPPQRGDVDREPGPWIGRQEVGAAAEDRKSTRLNSSHLVISYAVFCLKKKN